MLELNRFPKFDAIILKAADYLPEVDVERFITMMNQAVQHGISVDRERYVVLFAAHNRQQYLEALSSQRLLQRAIHALHGEYMQVVFAMQADYTDMLYPIRSVETLWVDFCRFMLDGKANDDGTFVTKMRQAFDGVEKGGLEKDGESLGLKLKPGDAGMKSRQALAELKDEFEATLGYVTGQSLTINVYAADETPEWQAILPEEAETVALDIHYTSFKNSIINPQRIVAVPWYMLRFAPWYSAKAMLTGIAMRQLYFLKQNSRMVNANKWVQIPVQAVCQWAAISKAGFHRLMAEHQLDWCVQKQEEARYMVDENTHHLKREANAWRFRVDLLTPGDASDVRTWLLAHPAARVIDQMAAMAEALAEVLVYPYRLPQADDYYQAPVSLVTVLTDVTGKPLDRETQQAAEALRAVIQREDKFISVPWYLFTDLLPETAHEVVLAYLMAYRLLYFTETYQRTAFWLPGGGKTLDAWVGGKISKYFPKDDPITAGSEKIETPQAATLQYRAWAEERQGCLAKWMKRVDTRKGKGGGKDWLIEVLPLPLTVEDGEIVAFCEGLIEQCTRQGLMDVLSELPEAEIMAHLTEKASNNETFNRVKTSNFETVNGVESSNFETFVDMFSSNFETFKRLESSYFETVLKILNTLKHINFKDTLQNQDTGENQHAIAAADLARDGWGRHETWDGKVLLRLFGRGIKPRVREGVLPDQLMSWLLYGCFEAGVANPVGLAVAKINAGEGFAGGVYALLAVESPCALWQMLADVVRHGESYARHKHAVLGGLGEGRVNVVAGAKRFMGVMAGYCA